jgi:hypothetical protein
MCCHDGSSTKSLFRKRTVVNVSCRLVENLHPHPMNGLESGNIHLDDSSSCILAEGLDFEYPSSEELDDRSLNGSDSGNDDSSKELAPIEQEVQGASDHHVLNANTTLAAFSGVPSSELRAMFETCERKRVTTSATCAVVAGTWDMLLDAVTEFEPTHRLLVVVVMAGSSWSWSWQWSW